VSVSVVFSKVGVRQGDDAVSWLEVTCPTAPGAAASTAASVLVMGITLGI
jgi:hypothetical protein